MYILFIKKNKQIDKGPMVSGTKSEEINLKISDKEPK